MQITKQIHEKIDQHYNLILANDHLNWIMSSTPSSSVLERCRKVLYDAVIT